MHADYIANPLYDNNPFIEALPPMLSGKDLICRFCSPHQDCWKRYTGAAQKNEKVRRITCICLC